MVGRSVRESSGLRKRPRLPLQDSSDSVFNRGSQGEGPFEQAGYCPGGSGRVEWGPGPGPGAGH